MKKINENEKCKCGKKEKSYKINEGHRDNNESHEFIESIVCEICAKKHYKVKVGSEK